MKTSLLLCPSKMWHITLCTYLHGRKDCKKKKKKCEWVTEKFIKCGTKECELSNCFRKCGIKDCDPSIFREIREQKLQGFI